jgi:hypothetical protein
MPLTNAEKQRQYRERKREREEAERRSKAGKAARQRRAELDALVKREAIRTGVEPVDVHKRVLDREGNLLDLREILTMDTWDTALEDERQAEAEADGSWPVCPTLHAFDRE